MKCATSTLRARSFKLIIVQNTQREGFQQTVQKVQLTVINKFTHTDKCKKVFNDPAAI